MKEERITILRYIRGKVTILTYLGDNVIILTYVGGNVITLTYLRGKVTILTCLGRQLTIPKYLGGKVRQFYPCDILLCLYHLHRTSARSDFYQIYFLVTCVELRQQHNSCQTAAKEAEITEGSVCVRL